jgi:hypothetical protein
MSIQFRDQLAMAALTGLLVDERTPLAFKGSKAWRDDIAFKAYQIADSMIEARTAQCAPANEEQRGHAFSEALHVAVERFAPTRLCPDGRKMMFDRVQGAATSFVREWNLAADLSPKATGEQP